jgi:hypothetical protein
MQALALFTEKPHPVKTMQYTDYILLVAIHKCFHRIAPTEHLVFRDPYPTPKSNAFHSFWLRLSEAKPRQYLGGKSGNEASGTGLIQGA